jgi:hypothetical protein
MIASETEMGFNGAISGWSARVKRTWRYFPSQDGPLIKDREGRL